MDVTLNSEARRFVEAKVKSGEYRSAADAVNGMLALVREQEDLTPQDIEELRAEIDAGIADADAGRFIEYTAETVIEERQAANVRKASSKRKAP